ncbi:ABC transporter ATP-binding protein [Corynebacterium lubricantis]|uniref:ABC transporter ATP-binding protein n=1 Tax=Corynebacterium lubricantis TaxID=541095 RepID=UPI000A048A20|nr:ABC transporter ATP-binding protein [Corynebacterium lubricantis]
MTTLSNPTVVVRDISKTYEIYNDGSTRSIFGRKKRQKVQALSNINFVASAGESIGILGQNGSGKSTLLSIIAGSEAPTTGEVRVSSAPTLLGVSAALQSKASGRENIRIGLLAMGVQPKEVEELVPRVLEWTELGEAADRALSTYSSGMRAKLKFGISTAVNREILLIDEALSTGDSTFAQKAQKKMDSLLNSSGTVFIVSHAPGVIEQHCSRVLWLHKGEIIGDGTPGYFGPKYHKWSRRVAHGNYEGAEELIQQFRDRYTPPLIITDSEAIKMLDS